MSTTLFILDDAPYGNERAYNALRLARALASRGRINRSTCFCLQQYGHGVAYPAITTDQYLLLRHVQS